MSDKDLEQFFKQLKEEESQEAPDFQQMFSQAKAQAKASGKQQLKFVLIKRLSIAASILLVISVGIWQFKQNNPSKNKKIDDEIAVSWSEEENIMDWESNTDDLLPTEYNMKEEAIVKSEGIIVPKVTKEEIKEVITEADLDSSLYQYGAISDWESPTAGLMPSTIGMGMMRF